MDRPSYDKVDQAEREAQLGSRTDVLSKSFVTDLWMKVITRAIDDLALYELIRLQGKELKEDDILNEASAKGFLFDDDYTIPMDDYLVNTICIKCEYTWEGMCSDVVGKDSICPRCDHRTSKKHAVFDIVDGQRIKEITLKDLLSLWGIEDIDGFREGVCRKIEKIIERKMSFMERER